MACIPWKKNVDEKRTGKIGRAGIARSRLMTRRSSRAKAELMAPVGWRNCTAGNIVVAVKQKLSGWR